MTEILPVPELFFLSCNPGLGLNTATGKWTIRPEVGLIHFVGDDIEAIGFTQFGVGLERNFIPADDSY